MGNGDPTLDSIIQSVAGDMAALQAGHIVAVIEKANDEGRAIEMGDYITENRPDLENQVEEAVGDALARF